MSAFDTTNAGPASASRSRVIALHCSGADAGEWRALAAILDSRFDLLTPEHYGCERIGPWHGGHRFTLLDEAERTLALIEGCDQPVHLVGHSYGGAVALRAALERPQRVASLCLYEPSAFHVLRDIDGMTALAEIEAVARKTVTGVATGDYRHAVAAFVDYWSGQGVWNGLRASVQEALIRWLPKAPLDFAALINEPTPLAVYARLRMPVLILRGEHALPPSRMIAEALAVVMPRARSTVIAGAGHMGPLTHADAVSAEIAKHIGSLLPACPSIRPGQHRRAAARRRAKPAASLSLNSR